jgi:TPR repeat protein
VRNFNVPELLMIAWLFCFSQAILHAEDDDAKAWEAITKAAEGGAPYAQWFCGNKALAEGDYPKALAWFRKAEQLGLKEAMGSLIMMYCNDIGVTRDYREACKLLNKMLQDWPLADPSEQAESLAQKLGTLDSRLYAERVDRMFTQRAEKGEPFIQSCLGVFYLKGLFVKKDMQVGIAWLKKAADQDFSYAQNLLAVAYEKGDGVPADKAESQKWFKKAADKGDPQACFCLAIALYNNGRGDANNFPSAFKYFKTAADQGMMHAQGMLCMMYTCGHGVEKDNAEALRWALSAAELGMVEAQYIVGRDLLSRSKNESEEHKGIEWIRKAAEKGYPSAETFLAQCYEDGKGVKKDFISALRLYVSGSEHGSTGAATALQMIAAGMDADQKESFLALQKSAEGGNADDQYTLFGFYSAGKPDPLTKASANEWLKKAAKQGHKKAQAKCKQLKIDW